MPDVKHMKWWGWGVEGVSFHHEDKPAFRPFVINAIDLDVDTKPTAPMSLDDLPIPAPMINACMVVTPSGSMAIGGGRWRRQTTEPAVAGTVDHPATARSACISDSRESADARVARQATTPSGRTRLAPVGPIP